MQAFASPFLTKGSGGEQAVMHDIHRRSVVLRVISRLASLGVAWIEYRVDGSYFGRYAHQLS